MTILYLGLDVGSSSCHLIGLQPDGSLLRDRHFATSEANLRQTFQALSGQVQVHLEASELAA
jgi:N-acetylglucosamine kinase-like BadF-type ATPase